MAAVRSIDAAEHERLSKFTCPKSRGKCPAWMLGNPFAPFKVSAPKAAAQKVARADRPTYDRCATAMLAGRIYSWSIDQKTGKWLVRLAESDDWSELDRGQVADLLDGFGVDVAPAAKSASKPRKLAVVAPIAPAAGTWSDPVVEYLERLVFAPKRDYAAAWAAFLFDGAARPADPGTLWAEKVRAKFDRLAPALTSEQVA